MAEQIGAEAAAAGRRQAEDAMNVGGDFLRQATAFWQKAAQSAAEGGNQEVVERLREMSRETIAFIEDRMQKDMAIASRIAAAKSPADLMTIQMDFLQTLIADYNRQAVRVAEEAGRAMSGFATRWPNGADVPTPKPSKTPGGPH
ncbi:phasin family protein [Methyloraptor flagellatus]|uniref:Phasin family protein n=1 Tax=Methyloraptor flagellatus TaxID=3162530 RepID=A0AAU7X4R1_9HYPH